MFDIVDQVKNTYNEIGVYFSRTRQYVWPEMKPYLESLSKGDRVLDLGCGNGRLLKGIDAEIEYLGVDFSETLVNEAESMYPGKKFVKGDLIKPYTWKRIGKNEYDAIFLVAVLHHIPTYEKQLYVLKEARKRLANDGFLYLSVWNLWQAKQLNNHLKSVKLKIRNPRWLKVPFQNKWQRFCFAFDKGYLLKLLDEAGFEVEEIFYSDKEGKSTDFLQGKNLVAVAKT